MFFLFFIMAIGDKLTPTERRLFKEAVIREYKTKYEAKQKNNNKLINVIRKLRRVTPINIIIGLSACVLIVFIEGWKALAHMLLFGIVWITIISTIVTKLFDKN